MYVVPAATESLITNLCYKRNYTCSFMVNQYTPPSQATHLLIPSVRSVSLPHSRIDLSEEFGRQGGPDLAVFFVQGDEAQLQQVKDAPILLVTQQERFNLCVISK